MKRRSRICCRPGSGTLALMALGAVLSLPVLSPPSHAGDITVTGSSPATKPGIGSTASSWNFTTPTPRDTVTFLAGKNTTDGKAWPQLTFGPQTKFTFPGPAPKVFPVFTRGDGPGPQGSFAFNSWNGVSTVTTIPIEIFNPFGPNVVIGNYTVYDAIFAAGATGKLGAGPTPSWFSQTTVKDPWSLTPAQVSGLGPTYDVFFMAELTGGSFSPEGGIAMDVSYETAAGTESLIHIGADASGATVFTGSVPGLSLYQLSGLGNDGNPITGSPTTVGAIQSQLQSDVGSDGIVNNPLSLGFLLEGLPVPTGDLGDGTVAKFHVDGYTFDAAQAAVVPEPSAWATLGTALASVGGLMIRARRRRSGAAAA